MKTGFPLRIPDYKPREPSDPLESVIFQGIEARVGSYSREIQRLPLSTTILHDGPLSPEVASTLPGSLLYFCFSHSPSVVSSWSYVGLWWTSSNDEPARDNICLFLIYRTFPEPWHASLAAWNMMLLRPVRAGTNKIWLASLCSSPAGGWLVSEMDPRPPLQWRAPLSWESREDLVDGDAPQMD